MSVPPFAANSQFAAHDAALLAGALSSLPPAGPDLLVALDLDGTTVRHDTSLSDRVRAAVRAHVEAGSRVILSTGRGIAGYQVVADQLGMPDGVAVCSNGAITVDRDSDARVPGLPERIRVLEQHTFDPASEIEIIAGAMPEALLAVEPVYGPRKLNRPFPNGELEGPSIIVPVDELGGSDSTRLTVRAPDMTSTELLDEIASLGLHGVQFAIGWTAWLDFSPPGITKASALEDLRSQFGIDTSACLAVGDGANDIEMLSWAGVGVSMGDAGQVVHEAADVRTASVNDDGLALVLETLL